MRNTVLDRKWLIWQDVCMAHASTCRLHNMRTVYVLKQEKQKAVAEETLEVGLFEIEKLSIRYQ